MMAASEVEKESSATSLKNKKVEKEIARLKRCARGGAGRHSRAEQKSPTEEQKSDQGSDPTRHGRTGQTRPLKTAAGLHGQGRIRLLKKRA